MATTGSADSEEERRHLSGALVLALLGAGIVATAAPAPASAVPDVVKHRLAAGGGPAKARMAERSARRYWTRARMRRAEPVDLTRPKPAPGATELDGDRPSGPPITVPQVTPQGTPTPSRHRSSERAAAAARPGGFTRTEVTDTTSFPTRTHGRLFFRIPDGGPATCSATVVNSKRRSVVFTAGHCVHFGGRNGDWFRKLVFVPAYRLGERPFGSWTARVAYSTGQWVEFANFNLDIGALIMRPNARGRIQDVVGARGIAFNKRRRQVFRSFGYPAAPPFTGELEFLCRSRFVAKDPRTRRLVGPQTLSIGCDMTEGSSGGSWVIKDRFVNSLNSYKYLPGQANRMYGPYFGRIARDLYRAAKGS